MTRWAEPIVIIECTLYHFNYLLLDHKLQKKKKSYHQQFALNRKHNGL